MYISIVIIHIIASIFLIAVILLQAGRGGGLADSFGGSQMQNLFGTQSKNVLSRLTAICASLFIITCLTLAIISSQRNKSIVDKIKAPTAKIPAAGSTANEGQKNLDVKQEQPPVTEKTDVE